MSLTDPQIATLRADLTTRRQSDPALDAAATSGNDTYIASVYNAVTSPDFFVWQTTCVVEDILDAIAWANFTPVDAPDGTALWTNRALQCQSKQTNLSNLLLNRKTIDASRDNTRAGFQDALTNIPSGASGAALAANWVAVRTALARKARLAEKLLANTSSGNGSTAQVAAKLTFEGQITEREAGALR